MEIILACLGVSFGYKFSNTGLFVLLALALVEELLPLEEAWLLVADVLLDVLVLLPVPLVFVPLPALPLFPVVVLEAFVPLPRVDGLK